MGWAEAFAFIIYLACVPFYLSLEPFAAFIVRLCLFPYVWMMRHILLVWISMDFAILGILYG